ncbi:MAG TPA: tetratricopeptide repeat protein, partial [Pyrinomonadaceae bacterium]|nr:tetratricopeptide repeat protein [Pyrinomonadaceae bacterium]
EGFLKSIDYFKQAVDKDPGYSLAYSGLADSYSLLGENGALPPRESFPQARAYAEKALKLDETLNRAHLSLGIVKLFYDWNVMGAEKELRRAKELDPNDAQAYHFYGHYLQFAAQQEEARNEMKRGLELDPTNLILNAELGMAYNYMRQYDLAIAQFQKTLELDPNFLIVSIWMAQALEQQGKYQEALAELNRAKAVDANWSWISAEIGCVDALLGKRAEAQKIIHELKERRAREYIDPGLISIVYIALSDRDQAFVWLERAYQERAGATIPWIKFDPKYDLLRSDPRFANLLGRIGLPQ